MRKTLCSLREAFLVVVRGALLFALLAIAACGGGSGALQSPPSSTQCVRPCVAAQYLISGTNALGQKLRLAPTAISGSLASPEQAGLSENSRPRELLRSSC